MILKLLLKTYNCIAVIVCTCDNNLSVDLSQLLRSSLLRSLSLFSRTDGEPPLLSRLPRSSLPFSSLTRSLFLSLSLESTLLSREDHLSSLSLSLSLVSRLPPLSRDARPRSVSLSCSRLRSLSPLLLSRSSSR